VAEELPLQRDGARRERGRRRLRAHGVHGRGEERLAIRLVGGAVRLDEDDRVAVPEAVTEDGADERVLVLLRHGAQGAREGGADLFSGERVPPRGPEAAADGLAATDPVGAVSQEARDARRGEAVLVEERTDDLRLVERGGRAGRRVGHEQPALVGRRVARRLHDDGDAALAGLLPAGEALETVDDLVAAVGAGRDAERQRGCVVGSDAPRTGPKPCVARVQRLDGQEADAPDVVVEGSCRRRRRRRHGVGGGQHGGAGQNGTAPGLPAPSGRWPTTRRRRSPCHSSWSTWTSSRASRSSSGAIASPSRGSSPAAR